MRTATIMLAALALILSNPARAAGKKDADYYKAVAARLIAQARALGPGKGNSKLTISNNPETGATAAANRVALTDPQAAAEIMIDVANALITFAKTTKQIRKYENPGDPTKPFRDLYHEQAHFALRQAARYARKLAKADPQTASDLVITIARTYFNNQPADEPYRSKYRESAKTFLFTSTAQSAQSFAKKIGDKRASKRQQGKIKNERTKMGFN